MIKSIKFKKDFRCFKVGETFEFRPGINILVGDQGSGKSTLIELLRLSLESPQGQSDSSWRAKNISEFTEIVEVATEPFEQKEVIVSFDFERESVRDKSILCHDMIDLQMFSFRASHGMGNVATLKMLCEKVIKTPMGTAIILDEPDSALSPRNCYHLARALGALSNVHRKQVIASVHNPILIVDPLWDEVLSIENKCWMKGEKFLQEQMLPRRAKA